MVKLLNVHILFQDAAAGDKKKGGAKKEKKKADSGTGIKEVSTDSPIIYVMHSLLLLGLSALWVYA